MRIRFSRLGVFSRICRNSCVSSEITTQSEPLTLTPAFAGGLGGGGNGLQHVPSSSSSVTVGSTYSHQCLPSVDTGISQLDHLQARWMHTQATTGGLYCRQKVVRCRLEWEYIQAEVVSEVINTSVKAERTQGS